jgi:tRNA (guanine37-N1)-methyltransferase
MKIVVLSLFPDELRPVFEKGIFKRALEKALFEISFIDMRDFAETNYRNVDDYPFSHRKGMLLKADVLFRVITSIDGFESYRIIYTCPKGDVYNQRMANALYAETGLIIICGYFEGVDERIFDMLNITRISIGDFVLSSGELPALAIAESVIRLIPDVIQKDGFRDDSHLTGLLEYPQYTHPREIDGFMVPEVLLSGHHKNIERWQRKESLRQTLYNRIDLLKSYRPNKIDSELFVEIFKED